MTRANWVSRNREESQDRARNCFHSWSKIHLSLIRPCAAILGESSMTEHRDILGNLLNRLQGFWSDPDALIRRITVLKDDPEFARLTRAYKQKDENPAALLRYLTSLSDDPNLSSLLNAYRQKD